MRARASTRVYNTYGARHAAIVARVIGDVDLTRETSSFLKRPYRIACANSSDLALRTRFVWRVNRAVKRKRERGKEKRERSVPRRLHRSRCFTVHCHSDAGDGEVGESEPIAERQ